MEHWWHGNVREDLDAAGTRADLIGQGAMALARDCLTRSAGLTRSQGGYERSSEVLHRHRSAIPLHPCHGEELQWNNHEGPSTRRPAILRKTQHNHCELVKTQFSICEVCASTMNV